MIKKIILFILLLFCGILKAQHIPQNNIQPTIIQNDIMYTGSKYSSNVYQIGQNNIINYDKKINNTRPRKIGSDPADPFMTPITDVPILVIIVLTVFYLFYKQE